VGWGGQLSWRERNGGWKQKEEGEERGFYFGEEGEVEALGKEFEASIGGNGSQEIPKGGRGGKGGGSSRPIRPEKTAFGTKSQTTSQKEG